MYEFSRAIYRELAGEIIEDPESARQNTNHERVLRACEATVERLATDRNYFARPARTLFCDIRTYFPMTSQLRVLRVIEHFRALADEFLRRLPKTDSTSTGNRRNVALAHGRARRASGCRWPATVIAPLTSTSRPLMSAHCFEPHSLTAAT
jgi:hypothetical protein